MSPPALRAGVRGLRPRSPLRCAARAGLGPAARGARAAALPVRMLRCAQATGRKRPVGVRPLRSRTLGPFGAWLATGEGAGAGASRVGLCRAWDPGLATECASKSGLRWTLEWRLHHSASVRSRM
ncbi:hypothetical protein SGPA1_110002 [Streptomyces misionensis JCM 4497]